MTVKSARPDPASRFAITISDGFYTSSQGLADLGKWFAQLYKEYAKAEAAEAAPDLVDTLATSLETPAEVIVVTADPPADPAAATVEVKAAE